MKSAKSIIEGKSKAPLIHAQVTDYAPQLFAVDMNSGSICMEFVHGVSMHKLLGEIAQSDMSPREKFKSSLYLYGLYFDAQRCLFEKPSADMQETALLFRSITDAKYVDFGAAGGGMEQEKLYESNKGVEFSRARAVAGILRTLSTGNDNLENMAVIADRIQKNTTAFVMEHGFDVPLQQYYDTWNTEKYYEERIQNMSTTGEQPLRVIISELLKQIPDLTFTDRKQIERLMEIPDYSKMKENDIQSLVEQTARTCIFQSLMP